MAVHRAKPFDPRSGPDALRCVVMPRWKLAGVALAFFKMRAAYAHLTKKCVRAANICISVYYRSNYHLGQ